MKLTTIRLQNYRLFTDLECSLHPDLTVFVAPNGGGKTSILDAIRVLFDTYLGAFPTVSGKGIKPSDVRMVPVREELGRMESIFPVRLTASGEIEEGGGVISWTRALNTTKSGTTIKEAKALSVYARRLQADATKPDDKTNWPLLAYYGTGRLWNQKKLTSKKQFASGFHRRSAGYIDCMEPASSYKLFLDWFHYAYKAHTQAKIRFMEANPTATSAEIMNVASAFTPLLDAVRGAVDTVLSPSGWKSLWYSDTLGDAIASHDQFGRLPVSQLSDGIRTAIGLVADIAFRAVQLNPHLGERAVLETQGVVLIDEVDMHLHPEWQQLILANLTQAFPKIQFIVTTHSPQVLTTVRKDCIRIIGLESGAPVIRVPVHETFGQESRATLEDILDTSSRPPLDITRKLQRYLQHIEDGQDELPEVLQLRGELVQTLGAGNSQLQLADMLVARNQAKRKAKA